MDLDNLILKYALQNAVRYEGKAQVGAVIGKVFSEQPELKKQAKDLGKKAHKITKEVNNLSLEKQKEKLKELAPELMEKKKVKERKELPELEGAVMGKVVTRIPPEPSKYNHIGHAYSFLINYMYAKKYNGKCILRFEDTNPLTSKQEFVDAMKSDVLDYLEIKPDKILFASDDMPLFYKHAKDLIKVGKAYVCKCKKDKMRELRQKGVACECRDKDFIENLEQWELMLNRKFKEGDAVLRLVGDMESLNHVMRDPVIFRIVYANHYRQGEKYAVWPMYDFENAIEDSVNGVTHILRSSEFGTMRIELQNYIKSLLGLPKQIIKHYGRFNIIGATTKGREIREKIEKGEVNGWDDPRLVTLRSLRRMGIDKRTFTALVYKVGLSLAHPNIDWQAIATINRKIIDKDVNRYFFIEDPKLIEIHYAPELEVSLDLHPDFPNGKKRKFKTHDEFYIAKKDFDFKEGKLYRLMDCLNFTKEGNRFTIDSLDYEKYKDNGEKIIHWLPKQDDLLKVEIMMPDTTVVTGIGEPLMKKIEIGRVVQAQRFGFMRLDKKEGGKLFFRYTHK